MMLRNAYFAMIAGLAGLVVSGCVMHPSGVLVADGNRADGEIQTAEPNDVVVDLRYRAYRTVVLVGEGEYSTPLSPNFIYEDGDEYYQASLGNGELSPVFLRCQDRVCVMAHTLRTRSVSLLPGRHRCGHGVRRSMVHDRG